MGFKLGSEKSNYAIDGKPSKKMRFDKDSVSIPGVDVIRKKLGSGIMGGKLTWMGVYILVKVLNQVAKKRERFLCTR